MFFNTIELTIQKMRGNFGYICNFYENQKNILSQVEIHKFMPKFIE